MLSGAGIAMGAIEAAVVTIITRKVTAPALFDETPAWNARASFAKSRPFLAA